MLYEVITHQLDDSQLNTLIMDALKNSPDLQLANARLMQAEAGVDQADSLFDPSLSANAGISRVRRNNFV